jgi:hypothetical protein
LKKGERIRDFNFLFLRTLNKIQENQRPNDPVILGCYKNAMPSNVKFSIRASQIEDLNGAMNKGEIMNLDNTFVIMGWGKLVIEIVQPNY